MSICRLSSDFIVLENSSDFNQFVYQVPINLMPSGVYRNIRKNHLEDMFPFPSFCYLCVLRVLSMVNDLLSRRKKGKNFSDFSLSHLIFGVFSYFRHSNAIHSTCVDDCWDTIILT